MGKVDEVAGVEGVKDASSNERPIEIVLRHPYPVVDAAFADFLWHVQHAYPDVKFDRKMLTAGSSRYPAITKIEGHPIAITAFIVRMVSEDLTLIRTEARQDDIATQQVFALLMLFFPVWLERDQQKLRELATVEFELQAPADTEAAIRGIAQRIPQIKRVLPGRPTDPHNDWARQEVARGRDRESVFREYLQRQGYNPDDKDTRDSHRERFKKAIGRTKRT